MPAPFPRMHGLTHAPGGPDPIPASGTGIQFDIDNVGGTLRIETEDTLSGTPSPTSAAIRIIADQGAISIASETGDISIQSGQDTRVTSDRDTIWSADRDVYCNADRDIGLVAQGEVLIQAVGSYIKLHGLPTSDPGVSNAVWNDSGTLRISP